MSAEINMEEMMIRKQSLEEMKEIYDGMMIRHFPEDEIKPFRVIEKGYREGRYICYGLYADSEPGKCLAYAWMCDILEENWILLDYYAVTESLRGQGVGSWFLKQILSGSYTQDMPVIIEVEDPDYAADEKEKEKQLRRIDFYLRNGVQETEIRAQVFQVHYSIMVALGQKERQTFEEESLKNAYFVFYSHVPGHVKIGTDIG
ncbi:MAG: hypothetical protein Q4F21_01110 [Lachnospiraceae bacterium]|nr:hypothetical protein [Lachnospiraceae bacterium]